MLRGLERLPDGDVRDVLAEAGAADPAAALRAAERVPARYELLTSPEFDACALQARPTDLMRRRQHTRAALAAAAALAVCGALVALPGDGWGARRCRRARVRAESGSRGRPRPGPAGAGRPEHLEVGGAHRLLDVAGARRPGRRRGPAAAGARCVGAARGERTGVVHARHADRRPGRPPQLLYAGTVDAARVVILYDGLRIARYAEPKDGTAGAALDFARVDGATGAEAAAIVLGRTDGNVRYLTAPWVSKAAERDLMKPASGAMDLAISAGITAPMASPATRSGACTSWNVLQLTDDTGTHVLSDLGELVPPG
ncbi:hypothetical protein GCM10020256_56030 [Streptomyces thermocoprophilus]